jgi:hypothetical protein
MKSLAEVIAARRERPYDDVTTIFTTEDTVISPSCQPENIQPFSPPRFNFDDPRVLDYLNEQGYVIIKEALSDSEIEEGFDLLWQCRPT